MQYAPTHSTGRKIDPSAFSSPKRMGFKNVPASPQPTRIGKSDPWAFLSLAGRARGRMQYTPTHSTGRKIAPSAFSSPKRMGFKNVPANPQPTRIGKSDPWAFPFLAGRARGRMQYAPTLLEGRKIDSLAFPSLAGRERRRMQYAPTLLEGRKNHPLAFPPLAGRIRGRMQYAPTLLEGRGISPWAFSSLAGWIMGRMQYASTLPEGRKSGPWAFPSSKRMGFKNVPLNP